MSDLELLAETTLANPSPESDIADLIYKRRVERMNLNPRLAEFINSITTEDNIKWKYIYSLLNFYNAIQNSPNKKEYIINILKYAIEHDDYIPFAVAELNNIKLPYNEILREFAVAVRDGKRNVMNFVYDNGLIIFTQKFAEYAAQFNDLDFFLTVIRRIPNGTDYSILRDIARQYGSTNIVNWLNPLLDE